MDLAQAEKILQIDRRAHAGVYAPLTGWPGWDLGIQHRVCQDVVQCCIVLLAPTGTDPECCSTSWTSSLDQAIEEAEQHLRHHCVAGAPERIELRQVDLAWHAEAFWAMQPIVWEAACGLALAKAHVDEMDGVI